MAITVLGKTFESEEERREYFREELRKKLPELKKMEGFPIGEDEDIIELSDPPYYTACPNPWLNQFIEEWEKEKDDIYDRESGFEVTQPYSADVSEGKNNPIYMAHSYHTKVPHPAIMRYILHYTEPGDIVFDGFAGTGMTGVASHLCGNPSSKFKRKIEEENPNVKWGKRNAICGDLSPVAAFIANNYNTQFNIQEVKKSANNTLESVKNKYKWFYETKHSNSSKGQVNYIVWSEVFNCENCASEINFFSKFVDKENKNIEKTAVCDSCGVTLSKKDLGRNFETKIDAENEVYKPVKRVPVLINYKVGTKLYEKEPDEDDLNKIQEINSLSWHGWFPSREIQKQDKTTELVRLGVTNTRNLYTERNLYALSALHDEVKTKVERLIHNSINTTLSSLLVRYNLGKRGNGILTGTFYLPSLIAESNVFKLFEGKLKSIIKAVALTGNNVVQTASATDLQNLKSNSVDYIFTDPPFGENIMYSELNFIQESWLKVLTNQKEEAIQNRSQNKDFRQYSQLMTKSAKEFFRILKSGKWMTVVFSNTNASVWNSIQLSLQNAGFIISNVSALDKKQGSFNAVSNPTSVKQDLVISCYKPSGNFSSKFEKYNEPEMAVWDFVEEHLHHLPIHLKKNNSTTAIVERSPKILFDRLVAFYVQKGYSVPLDASKFQIGLRERFIERDGMFFTNEQVQEYDRKKAETPNFTQLSILVASEQDGVLWLQSFLKDEPKTYQDIQPDWMQALGGGRKGDIIPELKTILEDNFLKNSDGEWYVPDPEKEEDLEKLRTRKLLKQFETYKEQAFKPKGKIKECRVEALRAGFKQCYQEKDFETIVRVGDRIPNNLLMEDEVLLQFYDIAATKV